MDITFLYNVFMDFYRMATDDLEQVCSEQVGAEIQEKCMKPAVVLITCLEHFIKGSDQEVI